MKISMIGTGDRVIVDKSTVPVNTGHKVAEYDSVARPPLTPAVPATT